MRAATHRRQVVASLRTAFDEAVVGHERYRSLVARAFAMLQDSPERTADEPVRLPACHYLDDAVARVEACSDAGSTPSGHSAAGHASGIASADVARALAALAPSLRWYRRAGSDAHGANFHDGHANAFIVGSAGTEARSRPAIGVSLIAPGIRYPDHRHPPEELYLVLSPGLWRHGASDWFEPGIGGVVHNPPAIVHAMTSGAQPLLAIWCLFGDPSRAS